MFTTFIVQPIFNLLVLIYALIPGHNFGLAIILFTIIIRLLLWPLVKKQLHQTRVMRTLQPEIKRIKKEAAGNRQNESKMLMELYKERGVNPIGTLPTLIVQFIVLIGLYSGLRKVLSDPDSLVNFAYPALQHLPWMQHLASNIHIFDNTLFGIIDLGRSALGKGGTYWPAMVLVLGSAGMQYFVSKQLMPTDKNARKLRHILKQAGTGVKADQSEVNAAVGRSTQYLIPFMIFFFTVSLPAALSLYWVTGAIVAFLQQDRALKTDEAAMETIADQKTTETQKDVSKIVEAEIVENPDPNTPNKPKKPSKHKKSKKKKRR
ncbi:MAG: YidC/Oxa1 family membrane protein insertase [Candidatus Saccharimonadales bacterium]